MTILDYMHFINVNSNETEYFIGPRRGLQTVKIYVYRNKKIK